MFTDSLISSDIGDLKKDNLVGRYPTEGKETKITLWMILLNIIMLFCHYHSLKLYIVVYNSKISYVALCQTLLF